MSLVVWLPLNGNLENQGLSNITVTNNGATVDNNGKIGKCYSFNGSSAKISTSINLTPAMSFCAWVKFNSVKNFVIDARDSSGKGYQPIYISSTGVQIYSSGSPSGGYVNYSFSTGVWYHLVVSYSNNKGYLYVNGTLIGTVGVASLTLNNSILTIGSRYSSESYLDGKLNDIRIYDHALSPKEVKELAKGLVLHYRLAGPGQENLVKNSSKYTVSNKFTMTTASTDGVMCPGIYYNNFNTTKQYTLTVECDGTLNTGHGTLWTPADRYWTIWIYYHDTPFTDTDYDRYQTPICYNSSSAGFKKISDNKYSWTFIPSKANGSIRLNTYSDGKSAITVKFWNIKIEEGSISTPWCPNSADALYNTMGYNNNIEYDCSGYRHNGTQNGNFVWSADSPRYTTSYLKTSNSKPLINIPMVFALGASIQEITMACWWKSDSTISTDRKNLISLGANNFIRFGPISSTTEWIYCTGTGAAITIPNCMDMKWHHHVITFKGGVFSVYFDGELKGTQTTSLSAIACSSTMNYIGAYGSNSEIVPGAFSDARIYATALSAEDIAELYHSAVIVDNTGKTYAYEYFEAN